MSTSNHLVSEPGTFSLFCVMSGLADTAGMSKLQLRSKVKDAIDTFYISLFLL